MSAGLTFLHPSLLLVALAAAIVLWSVLAKSLSARHRAVAALGDVRLLARSAALPRRSALGWHIADACAVALAVAALARPQLGERPASLTRSGRDVLVLLDLSRSMNVADVPPTRLGAARRLVREVAAAVPGDRLGLVVFGGSAFLQLPLTADHGSFELFVDAASSDDLGDPATSLGAALDAAVEAFEHEGDRGYQAVLLVSDGEAVDGDPTPALDRLVEAGIPVFVLGVGTSAGGPVPADTAESDEPFHRDHIGRIVSSRLEEGELARIAEQTGGAYARWDDRAALARLTGALGALDRRPVPSGTAVQRVDRFQWLLAAALALLGAPALVAMWRVRRRVATVVPFMLLGALACSGSWRALRADRDFAAGRWDAAFAAFDRAHEASGDPRYGYNAGSALYRMERYADAATRFREATAAPSDPLRQRSWYNLGTAYVRLGEEDPTNPEPLEQAIAAYRRALELDPGDIDAKWNLELAIRRIGADRLSGGSSGRGRSADYGRGEMNVPGYEGNPDAAVGAMAGGGHGAGEGESVEELSEAEARRLLDAVQRQQLSTHEGRPSERGPRGQKDW